MCSDKLQTSCEYDVCVASEGDALVIWQNVIALFHDEVAMVCDIEDVGALFNETNTVAVTMEPTFEPTPFPTKLDRSALVTMMCDDILTTHISQDAGASWQYHSTNTHWPTPIIVELDRVSGTTMVQVDCYNHAGPGGFISTVQFNGNEYSTTSPLRDGFWEIINATNDVVDPLFYQVMCTVLFRP